MFGLCFGKAATVYSGVDIPLCARHEQEQAGQVMGVVTGDKK